MQCNGLNDLWPWGQGHAWPIITKNNRDHLWHIGTLHPKSRENRLSSFWRGVFTDGTGRTDRIYEHANFSSACKNDIKVKTENNKKTRLNVLICSKKDSTCSSLQKCNEFVCTTEVYLLRKWKKGVSSSEAKQIMKVNWNLWPKYQCACATGSKTD